MADTVSHTVSGMSPESALDRQLVRAKATSDAEVAAEHARCDAVIADIRRRLTR